MRAGVLACVLGAALGACRRGAEPAGARPVVVFLHGTVPPGGELEASALATKVRTALAAEAEVRTPEGVVGACDWSDDVKRARCWPSDARGLEAAKRIVAGWALPKGRPTVLVGFSNGAAFALLAATAGLVDVCGAAGLHGVPAGATPLDGARRPLLVVAGEGASWEPGQAEAFGARARGAGFPVRVERTPGAHAVSEEDLAKLRAFVRETLAACASADAGR